MSTCIRLIYLTSSKSLILLVHTHIQYNTTIHAMKGEIVQNRIIVWNINDAKYLFANGYYGKPIGMPKPKIDEIDVPLILDLIEGLYLLENNKLNITSSRRKINVSDMIDICKEEYSDFEKKYQVYKKFRDMGYIVSPGIKFGCDFAIYEKGPGIDHAPYLVQVYSRRDNITTTGIVLAGRLASTVKKQFVLAVPRANDVDLLALDWWKA